MTSFIDGPLDEIYNYFVPFDFQNQNYLFDIFLHFFSSFSFAVAVGILLDVINGSEAEESPLSSKARSKEKLHKNPFSLLSGYNLE